MGEYRESKAVPVDFIDTREERVNRGARTYTFFQSRNAQRGRIEFFKSIGNGGVGGGGKEVCGGPVIFVGR